MRGSLAAGVPRRGCPTPLPTSAVFPGFPPPTQTGYTWVRTDSGSGVVAEEGEIADLGEAMGTMRWALGGLEEQTGWCCRSKKPA